MSSQSTRPSRVYHHGKTPAAWTGSAVALAGFTLIALGSVTGPLWLLIWIGAALVVAGLVVGWALTVAGYGEQH